MAILEIPCINVKLPVFHGTRDEELQKGAGHLIGSSLPVGGKGSHCVIAAHRGLPSAALFTDLNLVRKGDLFFIQVLGETLAYKVDQDQSCRTGRNGKPSGSKGQGLCYACDLHPLWSEYPKASGTGSPVQNIRRICHLKTGKQESPWPPIMYWQR